MDGEKKLAALLLLVLLIIALIPVTVRPLKYGAIDWVELGYQVYYGIPTAGPAPAPPIYLPLAVERR
jgi:hypothetical protein